MSTFRDDLLLIGPGNKYYTYMAQAVNRGVTLIGLWDQRHPGMADYIPVSVEHAIEPDTTLTFVGDVICFSTHLLSQNGLYTFPFSTTQLTGLESNSSLRDFFPNYLKSKGLSEKEDTFMCFIIFHIILFSAHVSPWPAN